MHCDRFFRNFFIVLPAPQNNVNEIKPMQPVTLARIDRHIEGTRLFSIILLAVFYNFFFEKNITKCGHNGMPAV